MPAVTVAPEAREAQRKFEAHLARDFPAHADPEESFSRAIEKAKEFQRRHLANALGCDDPGWIDRVGHAADQFIDAMDAAIGETQHPVRARFIPEAL